MSAAHRAFWLPPSMQSETANDLGQQPSIFNLPLRPRRLETLLFLPSSVNCEIQAKDEMMFMMLIAQALASSKHEAQRICIDSTNLKPHRGKFAISIERLGLRAGSGGRTDLQDSTDDVGGLGQ